MNKINILKYFSSFAAVKLAKKSKGNHLLNKQLPSLFFANFTAAKDEKYFSEKTGKKILLLYDKISR